VSDALSLLHHVTTDIRGWAPGRVSLGGFVTQRIGALPASVVEPPDPDEDLRLHALAIASVPTDLLTPAHAAPADTTGPAIQTMWTEFDGVIRRYLASKLFASWWPYLGLDLLSVIEAIRVHAAVLRVNIGHQIETHGTGPQAMVEAIRDTDLLMVHLSDSRVLARLMSSRS
jgi:hypothetical protein